MNIFICRTIFQVYYAGIIIREKKLSNLHFIYLAEEVEKREISVLEKYIGEYYIIDGKGQLSRVLNQVKWLLLLKCKSEDKKDELSLYFASIDDLFIQTVMSLFHFDNIYTFDDGTANYIDNSIFFIEQKASFKVRLKYALMGNKIKNINEVKKRIKKHYTSNNLPNILDEGRTEYIPLVNMNELYCTENNCERSVVNVYLCPNFDEVYIQSHIVRESFLARLNPEDIVIPHPRDKFCWEVSDQFILSKSTIAEEIISELIIDGYYVNLFGIANSTQYHYLSNDRVNNIILNIGIMKPRIGEIIQRQIELFTSLVKAHGFHS